MSSATPFVHLHCHTDYSLLDGACEIGAADGPGRRAEDAGRRHDRPRQPVRRGGVLQRRQGEGRPSRHRLRSLRLAARPTSRSETDRYNHLVLLCENQEGYRNLIKLVSTAFLEGFYYKPRIDKDLLARHSKGLIAMSACLRGDINETLLANRYEEAKRLAYALRRHVRQREFLPRNSGSRAGSGQDRRSAGPPALAGNAHPAGGHQRFALHAQGRRARARDPAVHPDRQDHERSAAHAFHAAGVLFEDPR